MRPFCLFLGNFSRQGLAQQEEICALKETVVQLNKEKATLQNSVEEGREKIATLEESLSIKVCSNKLIVLVKIEKGSVWSTHLTCWYLQQCSVLT